MVYLLDANVFIQAKNLYYPFDVCPGFWDWLIAQNAAGNLFSIEKVGDELGAGSDELTVWAMKQGPAFFLKPDPLMMPAAFFRSSAAGGVFVMKVNVRSE